MHSMSSLRRFAGSRLVSLVVLLSVVVSLVAVATVGSAPSRAEEKQAAVEPRPVDDSMHHFMEYFFEPAYKRLKAQMAQEPADNAGWKNVKGDALTLAEGCNLLLLRAPEEDAESWRQLSAEVRELAAKVYQAGREKNYAQGRSSYQAMIARCNACHDDFAGGDHQLEP